MVIAIHKGDIMTETKNQRIRRLCRQLTLPAETFLSSDHSALDDPVACEAYLRGHAARLRSQGLCPDPSPDVTGGRPRADLLRALNTIRQVTEVAPARPTADDVEFVMETITGDERLSGGEFDSIVEHTDQPAPTGGNPILAGGSQPYPVEVSQFIHSIITER